MFPVAIILIQCPIAPLLSKTRLHMPIMHCPSTAIRSILPRSMVPLQQPIAPSDNPYTRRLHHHQVPSLLLPCIQMGVLMECGRSLSATARYVFMHSSLPVPNTNQHSFSQMGFSPSQSNRSSSVSGLIQAQVPKAPSGIVSEKFTVVDQGVLSKATQSTPLHNFINISSQQYELPYTKCECLPTFFMW